MSNLNNIQEVLDQDLNSIKESKPNGASWLRILPGNWAESLSTIDSWVISVAVIMDFDYSMP